MAKSDEEDEDYDKYLDQLESQASIDPDDSNWLNLIRLNIINFSSRGNQKSRMSLKVAVCWLLSYTWADKALIRSMKSVTLTPFSFVRLIDSQISSLMSVSLA